MSNKDIPEWEKKYWATRQAQAQGQPVQQQVHHQPSVNPGGGELDLTQMLAQRIMNQQGPTGIGFGAPMHHPPTQAGNPVHQRVCFLKEGTHAYRMVSSDFGTEIPLVIASGPITGITGRQFENKGKKRCYLVDSHSGMVGASIDLSKMNESPEKFITLVQVSAPLLGSVLVPEHSVIAFSTPEQNKNTLLKG